MKKRKTVFIMIILLSEIISNSCSKSEAKFLTQKKSKKADATFAIAPIIIYKTKGDYYKLVPVILSEDKTKITSFPDIKDVYYKGKLAYPTRLDKGYLLDNRGINQNVAFLKITYDEYSKLNKTPSSYELFKMILYPEPLLEMYECSSLHKSIDEIEKINALINNDELKRCRKLK